MTTQLDHFVIGAATLEQGIAYVQEELGVTIPKGGEHPIMGTHNHLMNMGGEVFLEVIAINPNTPAPSRPRWFSLDDPVVQQSIQHKPRLLTWAVNTDNLVQLLSKTDFQFGKVTPVTRGALSWLFAVPDDGRLLASGMLPSILEWQTDAHPALAMQNLSCQFVSMTIHHPYAAWIESILNGIGAAGIANIKALPVNELPYISVSINTEGGVRELTTQL